MDGHIRKNPIENSLEISDRYMLNHIWFTIYGEPYMTPEIVIYGHYFSPFFAVYGGSYMAKLRDSIYGKKITIYGYFSPYRI